MIRMDRFTLKAQEAIEQAQQVAQKHDHQNLLPLHMLVALVAQPDGVVQPVLGKLGTSPDTVLMDADRAMKAIPQVTGAGSIFSSKDEPKDGGWGFLRSWGSFLVFWF